MTYIIAIPPVAEPVTLAEVKAGLRIDADITAFDSDLSLLIQSARELAEHETGRSLMIQTVRLELEDWSDVIEIRCAPVQSITSIQFWDGAAWQTFSNTGYSLYQDGLLWKVELTAYWPVLGDRAGPRVKVTFEAGYQTAELVPACVKRWIIAQVGVWFRSPEAAGAKLEISPLFSGLLDPVRLYL